MATLPNARDKNWGSTLNDYLRTEHNDDGTHTVAAATGENFKTTGHTATQVSTSVFRIAGADHTGIYTKGLKVRFNGNDSYVATVQSAAYSGGNTNVTLDTAIVPASITSLERGIMRPDSAAGGAIPGIAYLGEWHHVIANLYAVPGYSPIDEILSTGCPAIKFSGSVDNKVRFAFRIPTKVQGIDGSKDLKFHLYYAMSAPETGKKVSINIDYVVRSGAATSVEDEITVPSTASPATHDGVNLKIPSGYTLGEMVYGTLWRDVDGCADNHSGYFMLMEGGFWVTNE